MSVRTPLAPTKPKTMPTQVGQVFTRSHHIGGKQDFPLRSTYLFSGVEYRDAVTGNRLDEKNYLFIVWQGDSIVFRTRLTEAEVKGLKLEERRSGLSPVQLGFVASKAFNSWQELEYRKMGAIK